MHVDENELSSFPIIIILLEIMMHNWGLKKRDRDERNQDKNKSKKRKTDKNNEGGLDLTSLLSGADIETESNHIYFYGEVSMDNCLELNRKIMQLNRELKKWSIDYNSPPPKIYLHIYSNGGDLFSGFSSVDIIKNSEIPIVSIIEGSAASAATLMSVVASERYMTKNAFMLIHELRSGVIGKFSDIDEEMKNCEALMEKIYDIYEENTSLTEKKLKKLLKKDMWWDFETCLKHKLVDGCWPHDHPQVKTRYVGNTKIDVDIDDEE